MAFTRLVSCREGNLVAGGQGWEGDVSWHVSMGVAVRLAQLLKKTHRTPNVNAC